MDLKHKNGTWVNIEVGTTVLKKKGKTIGTLNILRDITERKKLEDTLLISEGKYRSIFKSVPNLIMSIDKNEIIVNCNNRIQQLLGYKPDEIIGQSIAKIIHPDYLGKVQECLKEIMVKGASYNKEYKMVRKDNTLIDIKINSGGLKNEKGEYIQAICIIEDVTERTVEKEKKRQLIHNLKFLSESSMKFVEITPEENIHQCIADQIYELLGNCYVLVNSYDSSSNTMELKATTGIGKQINTVLKILGRDLIGMSFIMTDDFAKSELTKGKIVKVPGGIHVLSFGKLPKKVCSAIEKVLGIREIYSMGFARGGKLYGNAVILLRGDFEFKDMDVAETFMHQASVTLQRKQAEEELKKSKRKIEQQNIELKKLDKIKSDFLNVTSHELRTPISAIKGYVQMLLRQTLGEITDEEREALDVILRNINRLDALIKDILDVSRIESGTMKFIPEKTNVKTLVEETTQTMKSYSDRKKITINADIEEGIPRLKVDRGRIKQVMLNLLNNAIKFSPDGSIVNVKARKEKDEVLFEVQDFGRGIPRDKQDKVFETFFQVDSSMDRKFGGAGLGLTISRGIVRSHGGKIWVESKEGKGSTFRFTIPVKHVKDMEKRFKELDMFSLDNGGVDRK